MDLYSLYEVVKEALIQEQIIEKDNRILGLDPIRFNEMVDYWNMMNPEHKIEKI
jgi:ribulose 1,5-bisphosphate carboxylase large subunit-like protein